MPPISLAISKFSAFMCSSGNGKKMSAASATAPGGLLSPHTSLAAANAACKFFSAFSSVDLAELLIIPPRNDARDALSGKSRRVLSMDASVANERG